MTNGTVRFKIVNNHLNTNIYSYSGTFGGQRSNLFLNVVHFFNNSVNKTSVAASNSYFPTLMYNTCSSIIRMLFLKKVQFSIPHSQIVLHSKFSFGLTDFLTKEE